MRAGVFARLEDLASGSSLEFFRLRDGSERPLVAPAEAESFGEILALAAREGWRCLVLGQGTGLAACNPHQLVDLVLSTRRFTGIVAYEPGDGTLTARAGTCWIELARAAAGGGHHLTPDVPGPERRTLGGVLGSGKSGFDRLRYGPVRHQVLGTRVALADGTLTKSGGRLVKNVTGYDLHRLYCGSHGTLGVILEASLRLYPAPAAEAVVRATFVERSDALRAARRVAELPVRPVAVLVQRSRADAWEFAVFLANRREVLEAEIAQLSSAFPSAHCLGDEEAAALRRKTRDRGIESEGSAVVEIALLPSRVERTLELVERAAHEQRIPIGVACHPAIATISLALWNADDLPAPRLLALHRSLEGLGARFPARFHWTNAPRALRGSIDVFGPPSSALAWAQRLKRALDPAGVFARGGFHGGL